MMAITLGFAVPMWIEDMRDWDPDRRVRAAHNLTDVIASKGDVLQFGGKKGEAGAAFNALAQGLACLAYCPGGVTFAGMHWEADQVLAEWDTMGTRLLAAIADQAPKVRRGPPPPVRRRKK